MTTSERIEWEARRCAAAFGVELGEPAGTSFGHSYYIRLQGDGTLQICIDEQGRMNQLSIFNDDSSFTYCELFYSFGKPRFYVGANHICYLGLMARGLYLLGFADETVLAQLSSLTQHEKIELMLDFPREFWPPKWIEEAA